MYSVQYVNYFTFFPHDHDGCDFVIFFLEGHSAFSRGAQLGPMALVASLHLAETVDET